MKIAIPVNNQNKVDGHFGQCEIYRIVTIEDNQVTASENLDSPKGCGCKSTIAHTLAQKGVTTMLAGGIGAGAVTKLSDAGISVLRGCSGDIDILIEKYIAGAIIDNGSNCNSHEHHHHHHHHHHNHGGCSHN